MHTEDKYRREKSSTDRRRRRRSTRHEYQPANIQVENTRETQAQAAESNPFLSALNWQRNNSVAPRESAEYVPESQLSAEVNKEHSRGSLGIDRYCLADQEGGHNDYPVPPGTYMNTVRHSYDSRIQLLNEGPRDYYGEDDDEWDHSQEDVVPSDSISQVATKPPRPKFISQGDRQSRRSSYQERSTSPTHRRRNPRQFTSQQYRNDSGRDHRVYSHSRVPTAQSTRQNQSNRPSERLERSDAGDYSRVTESSSRTKPSSDTRGCMLMEIAPDPQRAYTMTRWRKKGQWS